MSLFAWKPEYSVGAPIIDAQHQKLFRLADDLHHAMSAGHGKDHMGELLAALIDYTLDHFAMEEMMMRKCAFPGYAEHYQQHQDLTRQVKAFQNQFQDGQAVLTVDLMYFLNDWLSQHIKASDQKMAAYVTKTH